MDQSAINKLEEIIAHQSNEIDELKEVVTDQWAEIESLKKMIKQLDQRLQALRNDYESAEEDRLNVSERPPHY